MIMKAKMTPPNFSIFGLAFLSLGSNARVRLPINTVGCSLYVYFIGLFGEGSPNSRSTTIAKMRTQIASVAIKM